MLLKISDLGDVLWLKRGDRVVELPGKGSETFLPSFTFYIHLEMQCFKKWELTFTRESLHGWYSAGGHCVTQTGIILAAPLSSIYSI